MNFVLFTLHKRSQLYRIVRRARVDRDPLGQPSSDGRFASHEVLLFYFGSRPETCFYETVVRNRRRGILAQSELRHWQMVEVEVAHELLVADLRPPEVLCRMGIDQAELLSEAEKFKRCREIGSLAKSQGCKGILWNSRFDGLGQCIAIISCYRKALKVTRIWTLDEWMCFSCELADRAGLSIE